MSEKKEKVIVKTVGGGLTRKEAEKVKGGRPPCYCLHDETTNFAMNYKNVQ